MEISFEQGLKDAFTRETVCAKAKGKKKCGAFEVCGLNYNQQVSKGGNSDSVICLLN